ncbi:MAG TPA: hypothetical protein DEZ08_07730 [Dehalococcoidia bacterium]|nr:hypothetical protein [Dehalococcoidia bacterium]
MHKETKYLFPYNKLINQELNEQFAIDGIVPKYVFMPESIYELQNIVKVCNVEKLSMIIDNRHTGSYVGNTLKRVDVVIDMKNINQVIDFQPADLTVTVQSGVIVDTLQQTLKRESKNLATDGPNLDKMSIGEILYSNTNGFLRNHYGLIRDSLIGLTVIDNTGELIKSGGKVVKNVTGYDMNKLYVGSYGTLGIIAEATFKLSTLPLNESIILVPVESQQQGLLMVSSMKYQPWGPSAGHCIYSNLLEDTGYKTFKPQTLVLYVDGRESTIKRKINEITTSVSVDDITIISNDNCISAIKKINEINSESNLASSMRIRCNVPISNLKSFVFDVENLCQESDLVMFTDLLFGVCDIHCLNEITDDNLLPLINKIRDLTGSYEGNTILEKCSLSIKSQLDVWNSNNTDTMGLMKSIKSKFDPNNIFNPGRFCGGI